MKRGRGMRGQTLSSFYRWRWAVAVFDKEGRLIKWDAVRYEEEADRIVEWWSTVFRGTGCTIHKIGTVEVIKV
ncbi:MAG: hypothetical protein DRP11_00505 [Candidatus Aenigmatarchaeota archaeon]|nr:MAG: hypothetical protein DRP11_00505 [Candidatus Aenigmarchaeota archaeon]